MPEIIMHTDTGHIQLYCCVVGNRQRVICDVCCAESYFGARWKCVECDDYDLCDECYHADMHDLTHEFRRFDLSTSEGSVTIVAISSQI